MCQIAYVEMKLKEKTYLMDGGRIAYPPFGKSRLLLYHGMPLILRDRKGNYYRYVCIWVPVTGQYMKEFTGLSKEEILDLPIPDKYDWLTRQASRCGLMPISELKKRDEECRRSRQQT